MLIDGTDGFSCVGSYRSMEEALDKFDAHLPDVLLADIGLPGMNGIEGVRILKDRHASLTVLMLTVYEDDERIFDALCAGASGYLVKKTPPARLLESITEAIDGGAPITGDFWTPQTTVQSILVGFGGANEQFHYIDDVRIQSIITPEPAAVCVWGIVIGTCGWVGWKRGKSISCEVPH